MLTVGYSKVEVKMQHEKCPHPTTCPCQCKLESVKRAES